MAIRNPSNSVPLGNEGGEMVVCLCSIRALLLNQPETLPILNGLKEVLLVSSPEDKWACCTSWRRQPLSGSLPTSQQRKDSISRELSHPAHARAGSKETEG